MAFNTPSSLAGHAKEVFEFNTTSGIYVIYSKKNKFSLDFISRVSSQIFTLRLHMTI